MLCLLCLCARSARGILIHDNDALARWQMVCHITHVFLVCRCACAYLNICVCVYEAQKVINSEPEGNWEAIAYSTEIQGARACLE